MCQRRCMFLQLFVCTLASTLGCSQSGSDVGQVLEQVAEQAESGFPESWSEFRSSRSTDAEGKVVGTFERLAPAAGGNRDRWKVEHTGDVKFESHRPLDADVGTLISLEEVVGGQPTRAEVRFTEDGRQLFVERDGVLVEATDADHEWLASFWESIAIEDSEAEAS